LLPELAPESTDARLKYQATSQAFFKAQRKPLPKSAREKQLMKDIQAIIDKETVAGLRAIAAPVLGEETIYGAVSVSGPANRLTIERCHDEIEPLLLEATNELELKLQYPPN
jgi:DNA-binding IclR family transcriptional regulator